MPDVKPGVYKHYKGQRYEVIDVAINSETRDEMVVYRALYDSDEFGPRPLFTRLKKIFLEKVKVNGKQTSRFTPADLRPLLRPANLFWMGVFPFIIFIANYILFTTELDWAMSVHADDYLHFFGGTSIAFSAGYLMNILSGSKKLVIKNDLIKFFIVLTVVSLAAVLWEFYEFVSDILYPAIRQPTVADTIKDLVMGLLGGAVFAGLKIFLKTKNGTGEPIF